MTTSGPVDPSRHRHGWAGRVAYHLFWLLVAALVRLVTRLKVVGRERLPDGPFILSPVHRSFIDTPVVGVMTARRLRFMGKESLWDNPFLGRFLSIMGGFPVHRGTADREALRAAVDVLALGEPLVMFPEGTRREGPRLRREDLHEGPAFVAARAQVPIVPVGLGGTPSVLPKGKKIPRPHKVVAVIGDPIPPPPKVDGRVPRRVVREHTDRLYRELADLYVEARVLAGDEPPPGGVDPGGGPQGPVAR
ncbi:MAG: 1-acyl-sn-glycerol-3-phosphate acyltransferase [Actinomyces sp.]|nr:MAG: 1-acyl-sn-glycerol-3-phosphate acyltransferase [Actinomyces sp.]